MSFVSELSLIFHIWLLTLFSSLAALSFNQPKLSPNATWNPNATTFASLSVVGTSPFDLFVDDNNTIYVAETFRRRIQVWSATSTIPIRNISGESYDIYSLFVTTNDDVLMDSALNGRVYRWTPNSTSVVPVMFAPRTCYNIFVDIMDSIYCVVGLAHLVLRKTVDMAVNVTETVAGTGESGVASNMLSYPYAIFVHTNLSFYVADCANNRIQFFPRGNLNATTVVGNGTSGTINLKCPNGVTLDGNNYLFIVDGNNHRLIGSGPNGYRCIAACSGSSGPTADRLNQPWSLRFDTEGNIYVTDTHNDRIQKFLLNTDSNNQSTDKTIPATPGTTPTTSQVAASTSRAPGMNSTRTSTVIIGMTTTNTGIKHVSKSHFLILIILAFI